LSSKESPLNPPTPPPQPTSRNHRPADQGTKFSLVRTDHECLASEPQSAHRRSELARDKGFDIDARFPGTGPAQVSQMMQAILASRFQFLSRRETRTLPIYAPILQEVVPKWRKATPAAGCPRALASSAIVQVPWPTLPINCPAMYAVTWPGRQIRDQPVLRSGGSRLLDRQRRSVDLPGPPGAGRDKT
jgi:Protein of unknown function (DUF3738)